MMYRLFPVTLIALLPSYAAAQNTTKQPPAPGVLEQGHARGYRTATQQAVDEGKPLVVFLGASARAVTGAVICRESEMDGFDAPCIVVSLPARGWLDWKATLSASATDAEIQAAMRTTEMPQAAVSGAEPNKLLAVEAPWLPQSEQKRLRALMPRGVPVPKNLKFYRLSPVYQRMYTMSSVPYRDILPVTDEVDPWLVSGGMHQVPQGEWRNATALGIPEGAKITVWEELTDVRAFALVPKVRWSFPTGTIAYDVLIRVKDGQDQHVFEVRAQEKEEAGWDDGVTYRPRVATSKAQKDTWTWAFPDAGIDAKSTVFTVPQIRPQSEFASMRTIAVDDGKFTPQGYLGAGVSCNTCHFRAGQLFETSQIYKRAQRGDDGRFSWHPFAEDGGIDYRWPLRK